MPVTRWERAVWAGQRVGWVLMGGVLIAALLGLLGGGGLNRRTVSAGAGTRTFTYERVMRLATPRQLAWTATPQDSRVVVDWDGDGCLVYSSETGPHPERVQLAGSVERFEFPSTGTEPLTVALGMRPERAGRCDIRTRVNDGTWVSRRIFVLP